jgi:Xaa-Pro aminopeptidase
MDEQGVDGVLVANPTNVRYLTRFPKSGGTLAIVLRNLLTEPILIVPSANLDFVLEEICETAAIHTYGEFFREINVERDLNKNEQRIAHLFKNALHDKDRDKCAAAILQQHDNHSIKLLTDMNLIEVAGIIQELPSLEIVSDALAFKRLRMVKTDEEIRRLRSVARLTEEAIEETLKQVEIGVSQAQLACIFHVALAKKGALLRLDNISIGRSSAFGNANVPEDRLEKGQVIRFDVGAIKKGYLSDMARCYSAQRVEDRVRQVYDALHLGQKAALEAIRPGVEAKDVFMITIKAVRNAGLPDYKRTHVGHGIGLEGDGYDPPLLGPRDTTILQAGMVLCVETPYYEIGFGGLQVEDMVLVTDDEPIFLTTSQTDIVILQ